MHTLIKKQLESSRSNLDHEKIRFRSLKPKDVPPPVKHQAFTMLSEATHFITAFVVVFGSLMLYSNWNAYALITQDWIDTAFASQTQTTPPLQVTEDFTTKQPLAFSAERIRIGGSLQPSTSQEATPSQIASPSILATTAQFPPGDWLEVPKIYEGLIPIRQTTDVDFDYAKAYDQAESSFQKALEKGVLLYPFTAEPGKYGNTFITGHSSYYPWAPGNYKQVFALLHKLEIGDEFYIYHNLKKYTYVVYASFEVKPEDVSVLSQPQDQKIATLMTCTPIGTTLRRLIKQAKLISEEQ